MNRSTDPYDKTRHTLTQMRTTLSPVGVDGCGAQTRDDKQAGRCQQRTRHALALRLQEDWEHGFTLQHGWDPADPGPLEHRWAASTTRTPFCYGAATCAGVPARDQCSDVR